MSEASCCLHRDIGHVSHSFAHVANKGFAPSEGKQKGGYQVNILYKLGAVEMMRY